jgi:hypothetical protein
VSVQVARGELADPFPLRQHLLQHERVDIDHAVLEQVEAKHAEFVILTSVARQFAAAGKEHEVIPLSG